MRRAPIVLTATVLGTAGVLLFKPLPISSLEAGSSGSAGSDSSSSNGSGSTVAGSGTATPSPSSPSSSGSAPSGSSSTISKTVTGDLETDRYGSTQVEVTITDGRITEVTVLAYNDGDPRSASISLQAVPTLRQEVLSTQTAAVDTVSGATYTSNAYEASLQSALDEAGYAAPDGTKAETDLSAADANLFGH